MASEVVSFFRVPAGQWHSNKHPAPLPAKTDPNHSMHLSPVSVSVKSLKTPTVNSVSSFPRELRMGKPETEAESKSRYCNEDDFDPRADFFEFLEAAKRHASQTELKGGDGFEGAGKENKATEERKSKKNSWKKSLFSFWSKSKKKVSPRQEPPLPDQAAGAKSLLPVFRRCAQSGPITSSIDRAHHYPSSGPLGFGGWFTPTRSKDLETPYVCLDQLDRPSHVKTFGPIYLVT